MRTNVRALGLLTGFASLFVTGCGSGGGAELTAGAGTITITGFAPAVIPGGLPTPFTITGVNFETASGTTAQVVFHALGGATPFHGGTDDTAIVTGLVASDTTITGTTPSAVVCGVAAISFEVTVILESGVKSNTFSGGGLVFSAPTVTSVSPATIPAEIPTTITITGTGFGPVGGTAFVRFVSDGGFVLFGDASQVEEEVVGSVTSATTIDVTAPLAAVCGAASRTASISVTLTNFSCSALGASVLTYTAPVVTSTNVLSTSWFQNQAFTITGSGFGTTGSQVTLRFSNAGGLPLYEDGTKITTDVVGQITSTTTITGNYPKVTHCVRSPTAVGGTPASVTSVIRAIFPAGSCADSPAAFVTHRLPQMTAFVTPAGGLIPATNPTLVQITTTDFPLDAGAPVEFFVFGGGGIYQPNNAGVGTTTFDQFFGIVDNGTGTQTAFVSPRIAAIATNATAFIHASFDDGTCSNTIQFTWVAPPAISSIVNNAPPFNQSTVTALQADRFLSIISTQMNINGTNFQAGATVSLTNSAGGANIGTGLLTTPVVTPATLITGGSPTDATLPNGNTTVNVRVTNPDGQFTTAQTLYTTSNVRPNFNASFDTGTNSENQIAVNPVNNLNAVALAHQIATGGFANMNASVTVDGGLTWTKVLIGDTQDGIVQTFRGDPMVAFDAFGNCYMNYISTGGGTDRVMLIQFAPSGGLVTSAILSAAAVNVRVIQSSAGSALNQDRCTLATGGTAATQTIACGHIDFSAPAPFDGRVAAFTSTGAGLLSAATGPVTVASDTATRFVQHFAPSVGPLGQVYCSWIDEDITNAANTANVNFVGDFDGVTGGLVFGPTVLVGTSDLGFRTFITAQSNRGIGAVPMSVAINTGAKVGRIVITYADEVPAVLAGGAPGAPIANNTVVVTQFSDTQGITWSPKTFVRPATLDHHFLPWLGLDKANGNVYVTWKETADQPTKNQSSRLCAVATDGNAWNAPLRISQGIATPFVAFGGAAGDYLEYEGIAAFNHRCYAVWADNANFTATGATANPHGTTTSDAYVSVFQHKP